MITAAKEYTHAPNKVQAIKLPDNLNDLTDDEVDFYHGLVKRKS